MGPLVSVTYRSRIPYTTREHFDFLLERACTLMHTNLVGVLDVQSYLYSMLQKKVIAKVT